MAAIKRRQIYPVDEPRATLSLPSSRKAQVGRFLKANGNAPANPATPAPEPSLGGDSLAFLAVLASRGGDISDLLPQGRAEQIGLDAIREWEFDQASRQNWLDCAERGLRLAAQEEGEGEDDQGNEREGPWDNAADVHWPGLTQAALEFNARAYPELVKGDKAVGIKTFDPPPQQPGPGQLANAAPPNLPPQQQQMAQQGLAQQNQQADNQSMQDKARAARAERVAHFINWQIFYQMQDWEGETDMLLVQASIVGEGFKKVYMDQRGLQSDYCAATCLTVHNTTKSLTRCPRITQDFEIYPYEIKLGVQSGRYRDVELPTEGEDSEAARQWIEQHRMEDLDGDGIAEPYIVTVDCKTRQTMRIEAAFGADDVIMEEGADRVSRIERWLPFAAFNFLPDPKGGFYGLGLAKLLEAILDSIDTVVNQTIDAGTAEIAGGGFIAADVRLQGTGSGGAVWFRPGEYAVVGTPAGQLQNSIWERTVPKPSEVALKMLELLLAASKDLSSIKDVLTGDTPATAPVGTTLAVQQQALQVFSSIFKRMYRGFRDEFRLMFHALRRWATPQIKAQYAELTGGDFDQDFSGDGTDIQPIADPSVVTKMAKISRFQAVVQLAESPVGMAAGMQQPGPAQQLVLDFLDMLEIDRPERFLAQVPPNPELVAKVQELAAAAALKQAQAGHAKALTSEDQAKTTHTAAETVHKVGEIALQAHQMHQEAARTAVEGMMPPKETNGAAQA